MKRMPISGVLPPRTSIQIITQPPLDEDTEVPMLGTVGGERVVGMTPLPKIGGVLLVNDTDKYGPYMLVVAEKQAHAAFSAVTTYFKGKLADRKKGRNDG